MSVRNIAIDGYPEARNQRYSIPAAEFLKILDGDITELSSYYSELEWKKQI